MKRIIFAQGIILQLFGAIILIEGNIFGERTNPFAIMVGTVGIICIACFSPWNEKKHFHNK